jgi:hypothetical protein
MKLLLRRDQKAGMMGIGKINFSLEVRAQLSDDERAHIKKYKLGDTLLYQRYEKEITEKGSGLLGLASSAAFSLAFKMINLTISVNDLENGKKVDCKDIVEMLAVEQQIREAAETFKNVLMAAATFGGEEVVEI